MKGKGCGRLLLEECEADARQVRGLAPTAFAAVRGSMYTACPVNENLRARKQPARRPPDPDVCPHRAGYRRKPTAEYTPSVRHRPNTNGKSSRTAHRTMRTGAAAPEPWAPVCDLRVRPQRREFRL